MGARIQNVQFRLSELRDEMQSEVVAVAMGQDSQAFKIETAISELSESIHQISMDIDDTIEVSLFYILLRIMLSHDYYIYASCHLFSSPRSSLIFPPFLYFN